MADQPALHPERIRYALRYFREVRNGDCDLPPEIGIVESALAALELVRKGQLAVGLTGEVADAGNAALRLIATIQRIGK